MAKRPPTQRYTLELEYRFDRLLALKLEQVYQLLVPHKRWPVGVSATDDKQPQEHINELPRRDLCSCVLRSSKGQPHHHESDGSVEGIRSNPRLSGTVRV